MAETARFDASFKKVPGTLSVTPTHIAWVPTTAGAGDRQQQALNRVTNMLASKPGSARTSLKLVFKDNVPENGLLFTFTGESSDADRQAVQDRLVPFVAANRATPAPTPAAAPSAEATPGSSTPGTPASITRKRKAVGEGDARARRNVNKLREKVLKRNPTLKALHKQLVIGGGGGAGAGEGGGKAPGEKLLSEEEFWEGREALLKAAEMADAQQPGRASRILDDRDWSSEKKDRGKIQGGTGVGKKKVDENAPVQIHLTKELMREIFDEFPVVQHAYAKYVPGIREAEFFTRYFLSRLWEQHRASVRKDTLDDASRKPDDIFDQYLEDPDWDAAPKRALPDSVERFLDLAATEEDHGEATTIRDVTMQAGKERSALPLIRRFNQHSEKLVQAGRKASPAEEDIERQIEYDDLVAPSEPSLIPLHVSSKEDAEVGPPGVLRDRSEEELRAMAGEEAARVEAWTVDFENVCMANPANPTNPAPNPLQQEAYAFQRDAQAVAMRVVRDMHVASNAEDAVYPPLPENILNEMRSCHNAAAEFLRQFWSALLPAPPGALGGPAHSPAARAARAAKMASYLSGTEGKINAIVTLAEHAKLDPDRIRAAMAPTLGAVNVALRRDRVRREAVRG